MTDPQSLLLLHITGEGGSIQIKASAAILDAPVYREANESYDLDEDDADTPLQSTTQYCDFSTYWASFTDSAYWYLLRPVYVHPCLHEHIRTSLSNLNTAGMYPYRLASVQYWLDATLFG